jgi:hypothetical protein
MLVTQKIRKYTICDLMYLILFLLFGPKNKKFQHSITKVCQCHSQVEKMSSFSHQLKTTDTALENSSSPMNRAKVSGILRKP